MHRRQGFIYRKQFSDYRKQGCTQLHPGFYLPQASFMYRRQGFVYGKQVSDYCNQGFSYRKQVYDYKV